jgi:heptosyltransferase-1
LFVRVLIIKPSSLGDIIHTFPAVYALQQTQPHLQLSWVVNDSFSGIVSLLPGVERVIPFPRREIGRLHWRSIREFISNLRAEKYDLAIDFQGLFRSGLITWLSQAKRRAGFADAREGATCFYQQKVRVPDNLRHAVDKNLFLARALFDLPADFLPEPKLQVRPEWLDSAAGLLQAGGRPVLAVGFSSRWPSKTWPSVFFAEVIRQVIARVPNVQCWLLGSKSEHDDAEKLRLLLNSPQLVNLAGSSSMETLVGLLKASDALLTNDSGPMHIAAALQTPCVALFGATDPELTGPYGGSRHQVFRSLCQKAPCFKRKCPYGEDTCIKGISPDKVAEAVAERLKNKGKTT